eukprot:TRINITY_DN346_c0_g1_i7.p1 TRINITY_DN346_c0_g1~~TRINITY_DN346_c0_g1_i7.p1  ORF type:complete len:382 (-),score=97.95 TRINITY_DN346_c0_g1_i7:466-1611(-)
MKVVISLAVLQLASLCCFGEDAPALSLTPLKRVGKTLTDTFPFNLEHSEDSQHHHHQQHHEDSSTHTGSHDDEPHLLNLRQVPIPDASVGADPVQDVTLSLNNIAQAGERCVEKVIMVEEVQFDDAIECHHSYDKRCHTTYTTDYVPTQKKECDENFKKDCYIEYKVRAFNESVQVCQEKITRNCDEPGPTVCETMYEAECETRYHEHAVEEDVPECQTMQVEKCKDVTQGYTTKQECEKWPKQVCKLSKKTVKRYTPDTKCHKVPREICGPGPCPIVTGPDECHEEIQTIVQEIPDETCTLNPQKVCKFVTVLVPSLKPRENCVDVPKEICSRTKRNPRKVKKPVVKRWCYTPKPEGGEEEEERSSQSAQPASAANQGSR